jgi:L-ribulose-5-phosphate 4-epimerase
VITAMAEKFGGEIPAGPFALIGGDEIGRGVVATLTGHPALAFAWPDERPLTAPV